MKNHFSSTFKSVLIATVILGAASTAHATVGGPTFIYNFKYNPADSSVYYTEQSESGRGCPPTLERVLLTTNIQSTVISCSQGEALYRDGNSNPNLVEAEIAGATNGFKDLTQINLLKNNIHIDVKFVRAESATSDEFVTRRHFLATVHQGTNVVAEFPITGCTIDQPFLFGGYAVPGLNKKLVLVTSTKGDCWEGGYINETLHAVSNVEVIDRNTSENTMKTRGPLTLSNSTLTVYEKDTVVPPVTDPSNTPATTISPTPSIPPGSNSNSTQLTTGLIAAAFLILGVVLGRSAKR